MPEEVFVSKANGVYKRDYAFRMNVMEEIFDIRSCIRTTTDSISCASLRSIQFTFTQSYCKIISSWQPNISTNIGKNSTSLVEIPGNYCRDRCIRDHTYHGVITHTRLQYTDSGKISHVYNKQHYSWMCIQFWALLDNTCNKSEPSKDLPAAAVADARSLWKVLRNQRSIQRWPQSNDNWRCAFYLWSPCHHCHSVCNLLLPTTCWLQITSSSLYAGKFFLLSVTRIIHTNF